jgi:hypothetical protein
MQYPTLEEVETANRILLCSWHRFLHSPGSTSFELDYPYFKVVLEEETRIMKRIEERFKEAGGFTPEISKLLGWGE